MREYRKLKHHNIKEKYYKYQGGYISYNPDNFVEKYIPSKDIY